MVSVPLAFLLSFNLVASAPSGGVGVALVQLSGMPQTEAKPLAIEVARAMIAARVVAEAQASEDALMELTGRADLCAGKQDCARAIGNQLKVSTLVALEIAATKRSCALQLEAVSIADGKRLLRRDVVGSRERCWVEVKGEVELFAEETARLLTASAKSDLPREPELALAVTPGAGGAAPAEAVRLSTEPRSTGPRLLLGGGAAAAAAAAVGMAVAGYMVQHQVSKDALGRVDMTYTEAEDKISSGRNLYIGAGAAGAVAAALATSALLLSGADSAQ